MRRLLLLITEVKVRELLWLLCKSRSIIDAIPCKKMKLTRGIVLALSFCAGTTALVLGYENSARTLDSNTREVAQTVKPKRHRKERGKARAVKKSGRPTSGTLLQTTTERSSDPITPNRVEIDPGDIPPSERPRNPNVDDRTKIPETIDPGDRVSPKNIPKTKLRKSCGRPK